MKIDISEIVAAFPQFRVAAVMAEGLHIAAARSSLLESDVAARERACVAQWAGRELSQLPGIAVWRQAYRKFGIKKTSYRCSVERLVKNILAGRSLAQVNSFVDAYNAVSLTHVFPLGADDLDKVKGDIAFRYARPGDTFLDMAGEGDPVPDPPKEGEVVYADGEKILCRRWNWRQDTRSLVTPATRRAVVTVQYNGHGDLGAAVDDLTALLARECSAICRIAVADAAAPIVEIA